MLLGVSGDGRSLSLAYEAGGCNRQDGRPAVIENADSVIVTIRQTTATPGEGEGCTAELLFPRVTVPLKAPLAGRRIRGGPRSRERVSASVVPRVIGMSRGDALTALRAQALRSRTVGRVRQGRVVQQNPRPGTATPPGLKPPIIRLRLK
jgi:hypothetical protein